MFKGHELEFECQLCHEPVEFSVLDLEDSEEPLCCSHCQKKYALEDETLRRQLKKFVALCREIHNAEEILSHTSVGIDIGDSRVKVPYRLLLTRLNSTIDLMVGDQPLSIKFRFEPREDLRRIRDE